MSAANAERDATLGAIKREMRRHYEAGEHSAVRALRDLRDLLRAGEGA